MQLGHLLTGSDLTYPEVSSKVKHDSFCQLGSCRFSQFCERTWQGESKILHIQRAKAYRRIRALGINPLILNLDIGYRWVVYFTLWLFYPRYPLNWTLSGPQNIISLPWVVYFEAFYLHVVSSFSCIPVICPKLVLFLTPLQFVHLFCTSLTI